MSKDNQRQLKTRRITFRVPESFFVEYERRAVDELLTISELIRKKVAESLHLYQHPNDKPNLHARGLE